MVKEMALFGRRIGADRGAGLRLRRRGRRTRPRRRAGHRRSAAVDLSPRATEIAKSMIHAARGEDRAAMIEALGSAAIAASADRPRASPPSATNANPSSPGK
jgi:enoyl-CoA hydratase